MPSLQFAFGRRQTLSFASFVFSGLVGTGLLLSSACGKVEPVECPVSPGETPSNGQDASATPASDACDALAIAQVAFLETCKGYEAPRASLAEACRALTKLPGSTISDADLGSCTSDIEFGARTCSTPTCIGYGSRFLFPGKESLWWSLRAAEAVEKTGTLADGSACLSDMQCGSAECHVPYRGVCGACQTTKYLDQSCTAPTDQCVGGTTCSGGVCIRSGGKVGESCADTTPCQRTLYCKKTATGGVCTAKAILGESCSWEGDNGAPCFEEAGYCNFNDKRCIPHRTLGEACSDGVDACAMGLSCSNQVCVVSGEGWIDQACGPGCMFDMPCIDGMCRRLPGTGEPEGTPCREKLCAAGLVCANPCDGPECDNKDPVCRRFRPGDVCSRDHACSDGQYCDITPSDLRGTCHVLNDLGDACDPDGPSCQYHLVCADGRCQTADASLCR